MGGSGKAATGDLAVECDGPVKAIAFVDTTLRDGHLSLWASSMRTEMMLPVAPLLDRAGFAAAEVVGTGFFKKCVRELGDDPLQRLRLLSRLMPRTPLRTVVSRSAGAFQFTPDAFSALWFERVAAAGIRIARISDPSNTVAQLAARITECRRVGIEPVVNLIFSESPKHTDAYYVQRARQVVALKPSAICVKDPGGLLTPERTRTLVPAVVAVADGLPVEFHTHCTTGLGPICCLEAVRLGASIVDTCIPPLANGSSNPSIFNVSGNLQALGFEPIVDCTVLEPVREHFQVVARREGFPVGRPVEYNVAYYRHQIPGGMISNLRHQLGQMGMGQRLGEVLEDAARVRMELGYPVMVTPYSQFVGTQAAMNVIVGERYKECSDEIIHYALGHWGEEERTSIDPDVRDHILARPRAEVLARWQLPQPSREELRRDLGGGGVSDDDLVLRYLAGPDHVEAMRAGRGTGVWPGSGGPLGSLIRQLTDRPHVRSVWVEKGEFKLQLNAR